MIILIKTELGVSIIYRTWNIDNLLIAPIFTSVVDASTGIVRFAATLRIYGLMVCSTK